MERILNSRRHRPKFQIYDSRADSFLSRLQNRNDSGNVVFARTLLPGIQRSVSV